MSSYNIVPKPIASLPWRLIFLLIALASFGATILYSAADGNMMPWAAPHLIKFFVMLAAAIIMSRFPLEFWKAMTFPIYGGVLILLVGVEIIGTLGGGSQRWLNLGFMQIQPSELMKPAVVLAIAWFYDRLPPSRTADMVSLVPPAILLALPAALVLLQPDLGTTLAIIFGGVVVMFLAGLPMKWFTISGAAVAALIPVAYFFALEPYQQRRVTTFLSPEDDPLGAGYHVNQSAIAIGSGGFSGKGFLNGTQSHLDYLPEGHTDFVFATMAEEWGLIGGLVTIFGFYLLLRWGMNVSMNSASRYGKLVAAGLSCTIFFYIAVNLMMVMGLAPVVGIPLPFLSHGGSSMMTIMICIGIIMAIDRQPRSSRGKFG